MEVVYFLVMLRIPDVRMSEDEGGHFKITQTVVKQNRTSTSLGVTYINIKMVLKDSVKKPD
ncbi:MAG: hypothetical protein MUF28_15215 [Ignavibacterium sp.]|nr:hypothetical protein [Ignavibacterium sp.]